MTKGFRRKKFFFQESAQGKYIFSYFILAGLVALLFTLLFIYFSSDTLSITYDNYDLKIGQTPEILMDTILSIHGILIFICGLAIIYFATRFTHRSAGPIFKISRTIDTMVSGNLSVRIFLRKKDEYKDIADKINYFNSVMYKKLKDIDKISQELDDHIKHKNESEVDDNALHVINEKLKSNLSYFNLSEDLPPD